MRKCKCGNDIPWRIVIDGVIRPLTKRRHCLECRPYGSGKGRIAADHDRVCSRCNKPYQYRRQAGMSLSLCVSCHPYERHVSVKRRLVEMYGGRCVRCGYDRCIGALCFHHRDPSTKAFHIGGNANRSWEANVAEAQKCDLLCANCHIEVHTMSRSSSG